MARRKRAENHSDFAGADANQEAIETLSKAAKKANAKGKNTGEISEEAIARHVDLIKAAELEWREKRDEATALKGVLANRYKVFKNDGGDTDALKLAFRIAERVSGEVVTEQRAVGRYLKIMGAPIGTQWTLFEEEPGESAAPGVGMDAELQGQAAYRNSEPYGNCPFQPGTQYHQDWSSGWMNAQAANVRSMGEGESADA